MKKKMECPRKKDDFLTVEAIYSENMNTSEIQRLELRMLWKDLGRADFYANWLSDPPVRWSLNTQGS